MSKVYPKGKIESNSKIYTPQFAANFLFSLLHRRINKSRCIFDPACGSGNLLRPWFSKGFRCVGIDNDKELLVQEVQIPAHSFACTNFESLKWPYDLPPALILCNAPWGGHWDKKCYPEIFFRRVIELFGRNIPLVFLTPMGFRLNQKERSKRINWFRGDEAPEVRSIISCPLNLYPDTNFHNEILIFNVKGLRPHYWMPRNPETIDPEPEKMIPESSYKRVKR